MRDLAVLIASIAPGVLVAAGVIAAGGGRRLSGLRGTLVEQARERTDLGAPGALRRRFALQLVRTGWSETPSRIAALTAALAASLGALGLSMAIVLDPLTSSALAILGVATGLAIVWAAIHSAATQRRKRLTRELAPLLELFVLELGGGGSALSALGSVTIQLEGELASEMRRLLIASQVSGSASFEHRLRGYAETMQVPPLGTLATILTASREYGTGVTQGVRALAADLRRAQRRELIAHSRRALNHVLFPAAIGVLLPFLAILLFPAVSSLQRNLR